MSQFLHCVQTTQVQLVRCNASIATLSVLLFFFFCLSAFFSLARFSAHHDILQKLNNDLKATGGAKKERELELFFGMKQCVSRPPKTCCNFSFCFVILLKDLVLDSKEFFSTVINS